MTHPLTPREKVELKPCPFCGADAVAGSNFDNDHYVMCGADCDKCGGMVGYMKTEMAAIENWNRRTALASGSGDHAELAALCRYVQEARDNYERTIRAEEWSRKFTPELASALLAENAALRAERDGMVEEVSRSQARLHAATEAERKQAEAVDWIGKLDCECDPAWSSRRCGRCTFLSKEAERG